MTDIFVSFWAWLAYLTGSRLDVVTAIPSTFTPYAPAPSNSAFMRELHLHQSLSLRHLSTLHHHSSISFPM
jgi:hypothetical protein